LALRGIVVPSASVRPSVGLSVRSYEGYIVWLYVGLK